MPRTLSQLNYARIQEGVGSPRIVTLHRERQYGKDVAEYGIAAAPDGRVIGLESYKGIYIGRRIVGFTWFVGPLDRPSPLFFGDSLGEIERFLWDEIDRQSTGAPELPFLVGVQQGGIMALAAAAAIPDLLSGVIAINATLPNVPGWEPPLAPLDNLPILLLDQPAAEPAPEHVLSGSRLADRLTTWGAGVTHRVLSTNDVPAREMSNWVASQPVRHRSDGGV